MVFLPPSGGVFRLSHLGVIAGYPMQTVMKSRHKTDQPCLRFFWKVMLVGYVTAESQDVQPRWV
ncbi:MAG: hypothetical protein BHV90_00835 [Clostridiales bacterium 42_27]|nr:MAG: hypothetical protein BHV90_00835 [Clostridiales bacterium 42_27]